MTEYRIKTKKWNNSDNNGRIGILWISLNKDETKGDKLRSIVAWMDNNFNEWYIDLADTLDRHNKVGIYGLTMDQAEKESRRDGANWIEQQRDYFSDAKNLKGIISFDTWRSHPDFPQIFNELMLLLEINPEYRRAIENDVNFFLNRRHSEYLCNKKRRELFGHGANYILEETAACIIAARKYGGIRFYPGPQLQSIELIRKGIIPGAPKDFGRENYVEIILKRRGPAPAKVPVLTTPEKTTLVLKNSSFFTPNQ